MARTKARTVSVPSFEPAIRWSSTLRPSSPMPHPGGARRLARLAGAQPLGAQPLGDVVDVEVDHPVLGEGAFGDGGVVRPQPLGDLAPRRPAQELAAMLVGGRALDVPGGEAAGVELDGHVLQGSGARPARFARIADANGSAVSRTCGAACSTLPSATFIRPVRSPLR
jgi:hypothetical protein